MLTFSPALGSTTTLEVPPVPSHACERSLVVSFKATFDSLDAYVKAKAGGATIELWTNLPSDSEGRPAGEWYAKPFTALDLTQSDGAVEDSPRTHEDHTTHIRLPARLQDQVGARFAFTYRLVYPSGRVQWLGNDGNNGVVVVKQGLAGIHLMGGWDVGTEGAYQLKFPKVESVVCRVLQVAEWTVWAWDEAGVPTRLLEGGGITSNALILLPRNINTPGPVALTGNKSTRLHLSSDGTVSVQSSEATGRVSLSVLEYSSDLLEEALSAYGATILPHSSAFFAVTTHHTNAALPLYLLVLPISDTSEGPVSVPLYILQQFVTDTRGKTGLVLFSPDTRHVQILRGPVSDENGCLVIGRSGGTYVVSLVEVVSADEKTLSLSLLAPASSVSWAVERPRHPLPTPPPSPPARDLSRSDSSSAAPTPSEMAEARARPHHRRRASLALVRNLPARLLRAYVHTVFNVILWFWNVFLRTLVVRVLRGGLPRRISDFFALALPKTVHQARNTGQVSKSVSQDEGRHALPPDHAQPLSRESGSPPNSDFPAPHPKHASPRHHSHPAQFLPHVVISADVEGGSALPFLVVHGDVSKGLHATLDGRSLPTPSTVRVDGGIFLMEFTGLIGGGHLEVFLDL